MKTATFYIPKTLHFFLVNKLEEDCLFFKLTVDLFYDFGAHYHIQKPSVSYLFKHSRLHASNTIGSKNLKSKKKNLYSPIL